MHAAIDRAAQNLKLAGGSDKRVSRADLATAGNVIEDKVERDLTNVFGKFCDHRDAAKGATLGHADVDRSAAYAKEYLIDRLDTNQNGLSAAELSKGSLTAQLAALMAKQSK